MKQSFLEVVSIVGGVVVLGYLAYLFYITNGNVNLVKTCLLAALSVYLFRCDWIKNN